MLVYPRMVNPDLAPRREDAAHHEHDDAPEGETRERVQRLADTAAEPSAERRDQEHDQSTEPHAHREHVQSVEGHGEVREGAGRGMTRVAGRRREADPHDRAGHDPPPRRSAPAVDGAQEEQQAERRREQQDAHLGDVAEAGLEDGVHDRPLDRIADARALGVRPLQHHRRERREDEDDPADPDEPAGRAGARSSRPRSARGTRRRRSSSARPVNTPARAAPNNTPTVILLLGLVSVAHAFTVGGGPGPMRKEYVPLTGCESAEMTRQATR